MNRVDVKVKIPEELKPWLVDDWDLIISSRILLPRRMWIPFWWIISRKSPGNTDNREYAVNGVGQG